MSINNTIIKHEVTSEYEICFSISHDYSHDFMKANEVVIR